MHKFINSILLLFMLTLATSASAMEAIVVVDHFPPWKIVEGDKVSGIDIELTNALLAEVNITPKYQICPWSRCLAMLKNGNADMISGILKRPKRERFLVYIEPPYKDHSTKVFYHRKWTRDIREYEDLKELEIGVQRGALYFPRFDKDTSLSKRAVENDKFNFLKLAEGRLDAVIATESQGDYLVAIMGLQERLVKASFRHSDISPVHFAISKESPLIRMAPEINKAALRLRENGTFEAIIKGYFVKLQKGN